MILTKYNNCLFASKTVQTIIYIIFSGTKIFVLFSIFALAPQVILLLTFIILYDILS